MVPARIRQEQSGHNLRAQNGMDLAEAAIAESRRFTVRPPATVISWRGRMNREQAMDLRISSGASG
jgi:hypothetical protein